MTGLNYKEIEENPMNSPIRVLCVFSTLDRGGAESMCMNLYRKMDRAKIQFDFVKHTERECAFDKEILFLGGKIYIAPRLNGYNLFTYLKWWEKHFDEHQEHQIVHGHFFTISPLYFMVAHYKGRITIGQVHASEADSVLKKILVKSIEKKADFCLACSEQAGRWVFPHRKYYVLKNAIDLNEFAFNKKVREKARRILKIDEGLVLGTVANMSGVKNPFGLLKIFKTIHDVNPNTKLLWVGDGGLRKEIEQKIRTMGLEHAVLLLGVRNDVSTLLQCMDCFLLPSFNEGLPVSVIEAQAAGLPCFLSDAITREVDVTGLCTFLPIKETKSWADKILSYKETRKDTKELLIQEGYDISHTAKWIERFYMKVARLRGQ